MHHDTTLITTIVAGLVLAYIFGMIANRLRLPPLVGYLFAGILVGPHTPGFVADQELGAQLAELGVILLMFGVGLHFSLKDLMSVRALAIPGAIVQIGFATLLGAGLGLLLGWTLGAALLFGLALSVASTVVLLKALQDRRLIESERGRIAVGWLIVEDLAMVLALVLVPAIASLYGTDTGIHDPFVSFVERLVGTDIGIWGVLALTLVKVAAFVGFMLIVGRRIIPWALHATAHTGSRELFRLAVLAIALGVALGSSVLFGVSLALGAFFAGMILSESELSHRAANETLPLRDAFAVLFFVSVGMLFDPMIVLNQPLLVLATVFIIVIGKSLAAFGIVLLFRRPVSTALTISASLAQIGEFSFILASMGVALAILPQEGQDLILVGALISIVLNPVVFWVAEAMRPGLEARYGQKRAAEGEGRIEPGELSRAAEGPATTDIPTSAAVDRGALGADDDTGEPSSLTGHTVLVGYGQVGRIVAAGLKTEGTGVVVIEDSDHDVAAARAEGFEVVYGNAASAPVLRLANLEAAKSLIIAISNAFEAGSVVETSRKLNPSIAVVARAYSAEEEDFLRNLGATTVIRGEQEIGKGILSHLQDEPVLEVVAEPEIRLPASDNLVARAAASVFAPVAVSETIEAAPAPVETVAVVAEDTADEAVPESAPEAISGAETAPMAPITVLDAPIVDDTPSLAPNAEAEVLLQAEIVAVEPVPSIGEAPAEIDELVVPASDLPIAPAAEADAPTPDSLPAEENRDPAAEIQAEGDAEAVVPPVVPEAPQTTTEAAPEPSVAVPQEEQSAPAEAEAPPETEIAASEDTPEEIEGSGTEPGTADEEKNKSGADVPPVMPEPKPS
jgi:CPA2 family monovalent cation:H+ antiporter-2